MTNKRSRLEITLDLLEAVRDGVDKPTRIMYATNLSWKPAQEILAKLVSEGFLTCSEEFTTERTKRRYKITEKGFNVIDYFRRANALINV